MGYGPNLLISFVNHALLFQPYTELTSFWITLGLVNPF